VTDLETRIAESMRARADTAAPTGGMHEQVLRRATGLRRRRRVFGGMTGAAAVAVAVAGVAAGPGFLPRADGESKPAAVTPARETPTKPARSPGPTTLPELTGVAPAADDPAVVGTDPLALHFDVYLASFNATASVWTSAPGYEAFTTPYGADGEFIEAMIGRDPAVLDAKRDPPGTTFYLADGTMVPSFTEVPAGTVAVNGRTATLYQVVGKEGAETEPPRGMVSGLMRRGDTPAWVLRWQPVDGLHAIVQVYGYGRGVAEAVAGALRLDHAQRCATPLRLATPPAGGTLRLCRTSVRQTPSGTAGVWLSSSLEFALPSGTTARVSTEAKPERVAHDLAQFHPRHTINGARAAWLDAEPRGLWLLEYGPAPAEVFVAGLSEAESVQVVTGLSFSPDLTTAASWPLNPLS
jgi:hypothetical protein